MSGQTTIIAAGGATVPATGTYTAIGLAQISSILQAAEAAGSANVLIYSTATGVPTPPSGSGPFVLVVPNNIAAGNVNVPSGYQAVILGQGTTATIVTANPATQILSGGAINFAGGASFIEASGGSGVIDDTLTGAVLDIGGGAYSVTAGAGATIGYDNGAARIFAGTGDAVMLGDGLLGGSYLQQYPAGTTVTGALLSEGGGDVVTINSLGNTVVGNSGSGANTIVALYGSSTVFAGNGDLCQAAGNPAATEFIASGNTQTVFGGTGNDTVFGQSGTVVYHQGSGLNSYYIGGSGAATVVGSVAGGGAVFGGSGNILFETGNSNDYFVASVGGTGSSDTVIGGSAIPSVFGGSNEHMAIVGSHAAFALPMGNNNVIDASAALGGTNFFALGSIGNSTLIGNPTSAVPDTFQFVSASGAVAHTVTIENWHAGDGLFLSGYGAADQATLDAALNGGGTSITLSDGTTITFNGQHPTHGIGGVGF